MGPLNDSFPASPVPTVAEVERIAALQDPVLRNLQITQCYSELSNAMALRTGYSANWCTFATWASKQAGQSIRKEDLQRALERVFHETSPAYGAAADLANQRRLTGAQRRPDEIQAALREAVDIRSAVDRASDAVARGNKKVFEEIGRQFARFYTEFLRDAEPDLDKLADFSAALRPGEPPDGQNYLRQAFERYDRSFFAGDPKTRAELLLCANIEIGLHEQTRLQPEIAEALDAAFVDATQFTRHFIARAFSLSGWFLVSRWLARRLLRQETAVDRAIQDLLETVHLQMRQVLTETMMTIHLPPDLLIRLGDDLTAGFPETLRQLVDPDLRVLLARFDPTPDSLAGSGVLDWADLPDRLHFIIDLFRCYQESRDLFDAPFSPQQVADMKAGRLPAGPL
jgi:hypothetical protein